MALQRGKIGGAHFGGLSALKSKMDFRSGRPGGHCDPFERAVSDMSAFSVDIGHKSDSLYNCETFSIVHKFETEVDQQCRENAEAGYGFVTDSERRIVEESICFGFYDDRDDWLTEDLYPEEAYSYEDDIDLGNVQDDGWSCSLTDVGLASVYGETSYGDDSENPEDLNPELPEVGEGYQVAELPAGDIDLSGEFSAAAVPSGTEEEEPTVAAEAVSPQTHPATQPVVAPGYHPL
ncbi:MAG: hypothetical protein JNL76_06665 [Alphaproteobacteria bacterium]|nr:hypothetical protein [Alphaproteobacteria bacterium]